MSAAATTAPAGGVKKGKAKLMIIVGVALIVLLGGAGAAVLLLKKKTPVTEESEDGAPATATTATTEHAVSMIDPKHPPTFMALDPFVVNLSDTEVDRYAQIGITLEVENAAFSEQMKAYMPSIRNGILMILAHKSSHELLERSGKETLAGQIQREVARTMGIDVDEPPPPALHAASAVPAAEGDEIRTAARPKSAKRKAAVEPNPVHRVLFSNFIIQ